LSIKRKDIDMTTVSRSRAPLAGEPTRLERRPKGALAYPLNSAELASIIEDDLRKQGYELNGTIEVYPSALVYGSDTNWAVVNSEGVGSLAVDYDATVTVHFSIGAYDMLIREHEFRFHEIEGAMLNNNVDLADFIRVFGDRLDSNHSLWYGFSDKAE
jgi:hypothetical protein